MKVKELIEKLEEYDEDDEVRIADAIYYDKNEDEGWIEEEYIVGDNAINYISRSIKDGRKVYISKE